MNKQEYREIMETLAQNYMNKYAIMDDEYEENIYPFYEPVHGISSFDLWKIALPYISSDRIVFSLALLCDVANGFNGIRTCDIMGLIRNAINDDATFEKIYTRYVNDLNKN